MVPVRLGEENSSVGNLNRADNLKTAYERENEYLTRGAIIVHSRINWFEYREKNSKY